MPATTTRTTFAVDDVPVGTEPLATERLKCSVEKLLEMKVHPVDSQPRHFRRAAALAVTEAVQKVGLVEGPG